MDLRAIERYIGRKVFICLKNGFKYKFLLERENIIGNIISFTGKYGEPIDIGLEEISFITVAEDEKGGRE